MLLARGLRQVRLPVICSLRYARPGSKSFFAIARADVYLPVSGVARRIIPCSPMSFAIGADDFVRPCLVSAFANGTLFQHCIVLQLNHMIRSVKRQTADFSAVAGVLFVHFGDWDRGGDGSD